MNVRLQLIANRVRGIIDVRGTTNRAVWWISLFGFALAAVLAFFIYTKGLSKWLLKPDLTATIWAVAILVTAIGCMILLSVRRCNEMRCRPKWLWSALIIPLLPIWMLLLGTVPPDGMRIVTRTRVLAGLFGIIIAGFSAMMVQSFLPALQKTEPVSTNSPRNSNGVIVPTWLECVDLGEQYYKEIGSFPTFSTGEDALEETMSRCSRSPLAFGQK